VTPTLTEFEQWAGSVFDQVTADMDPTVLERLNLGVAVSPETNVVRDSDGFESLVLGTFTTHPVLGRQVELYYGSFVAAHGSLQPWEWSDAIEAVIRHELRHFLEDLQGRRDLAREEVEERRHQRWLRLARETGGEGGTWAPLLKSVLALVLLLVIGFLLARLLSG